MHQNSSTPRTQPISIAGQIHDLQLHELPQTSPQNQAQPIRTVISGTIITALPPLASVPS